MRARVLRFTLHFLAGLGLAIFLLPESASVVLAAAVAAAAVKGFYDHLSRGVDLLACIGIVAGALAVLLATI